MLYCFNCGKPVNETDKFCASCGAELYLRKSATQDSERRIPTPPPEQTRTRLLTPDSEDTGQTGDYGKTRLMSEEDIARLKAKDTPPFKKSLAQQTAVTQPVIPQQSQTSDFKDWPKKQSRVWLWVLLVIICVGAPLILWAAGVFKEEVGVAPQGEATSLNVSPSEKVQAEEAIETEIKQEVQTHSQSENKSVFIEDWSTYPFDRGWLTPTRITNDTGLEWSSARKYVYEANSYPGLGVGYYDNFTFTNGIIEGTFTKGGDSYDLVGIMLFVNEDNYYCIFYDYYRRALRFIKLQGGTSLYDKSSNFNVTIPSGVEFSIRVEKDGTSFNFTLTYNGSDYHWSPNDDQGSEIKGLKVGVYCRYRNSTCSYIKVEY